MGIFASDDPSDRVGLLEYTLLKVVANEEAERKLERAIRSGAVRRDHNTDWIAEAEQKGVLSGEEARALAEQRDLVARVIGVDDFAASDISPRRAANPAPEVAAQAPALTGQPIPPEQQEHIAAE
jgi:acyl-CoA dehydrogenase